MDTRCRIIKGMFGRWVILHPTDDRLAWSGSRWVPQLNGLPSGAVQICNFYSQLDAEVYASTHDLNF